MDGGEGNDGDYVAALNKGSLTMIRKLITAWWFGAVLFISVGAHDLFFKFDSYFLQPNSKATVRLLNGTFRASEATLARDRMVDASIVNPSGERAHPPPSGWRDEGTTTLLDFETAAAGTYLIGLVTSSREVEQKAAAFNDYLAHEGLPDILAERRKNNQLNRDIRRRYSKYAKAIFQVGEARTDSFQTRLGYPVELVPLRNPYALKSGDTLEVLCLRNGQPLANQIVAAAREAKGRELPPVSLRSDDKGIARFKLNGTGKWYVKFIHMTSLADPHINYESKWATLTFEIK